MFSNLPSEPPSEEVVPTDIQQLPLLPFAVQLQNIFPVEIVARRFPVDKAVDMARVVMANVNTQLNLSNIGIDTEALQAEAHLDVKVSFPQEPRLFEINFKLVGIFSYAQQYKTEMVQYFLQQGSLSVMLPSARELLLSLCIRLQVPMVVLPLVQLAPPPPSDPKLGNTSNE